MFNDEIRGRFRQMTILGERAAKSEDEKFSYDLSVLGYMRYLMDNGCADEFEDRCCCYWNISDAYAMMRNGRGLCSNHKEFAEYLAGGESKYKFWAVCDTTQRFTLILGGFGEFWSGLYHDATENSAVTDENYRAAYEAHRAAMGVHPQLNVPEEELRYADGAFRDFVEKCKDKKEYDFYGLIYKTCRMTAFNTADEDVESLCAGFYGGFGENDEVSPYIQGEWGYINRPRSDKNMAIVGITSAVNALITLGNKERASRLYDEAKRAGLPENFYIEKRLL